MGPTMQAKNINQSICTQCADQVCPIMAAASSSLPQHRKTRQDKLLYITSETLHHHAGSLTTPLTSVCLHYYTFPNKFTALS